MERSVADDRITSVVRILLTYRQQTQADLVAGTGIQKRTLVRRLSGERSWTAGDVAALAEHFRVPVTVFYDGPDALLAGLGGKMSATLPGAFTGLVAA